jgi:hypothetical protein
MNNFCRVYSELQPSLFPSGRRDLLRGQHEIGRDAPQFSSRAPQMIFTLYIFDRHCNCVFFHSWNKKDKTVIDKKVLEDSKLVYGIVFSLKNIVAKLKNDKLLCYRTDSYKLHFFESLSSIRFVLFTDDQMPTLSETLQQLYELYVEHVSRSTIDITQNEPFRVAVDQYIRSVPGFQ